MKKISTRSLVNAAFFSALATVLFYFEFPLPGVPLKMDLSDLPVLIAALLNGPVIGIVVAFMKNLLHFFFISKDGLIAGEIANFLFSVLLIGTTYLYTQKKQWKDIVKLVIGIVIASLIMNVLNYWITFPLYGLSKEGAWVLLNTIYLPFNILKGIVLWLIILSIYPILSKSIR